MTHAAEATDSVDLMAREEMYDPAISARKLLAVPRCRRYERFDPPFFIVSRYEDVERISCANQRPS